MTIYLFVSSCFLVPFLKDCLLFLLPLCLVNWGWGLWQIFIFLKWDRIEGGKGKGIFLTLKSASR